MLLPGSEAYESACAAASATLEKVGPEAIRCYEVVDFPAIVGIDIEGEDVYKQEIAKYAELLK